MVTDELNSLHGGQRYPFKVAVGGYFAYSYVPIESTDNKSYQRKCPVQARARGISYFGELWESAGCYAYLLKELPDRDKGGCKYFNPTAE